jgi:hypothetical protein
MLAIPVSLVDFTFPSVRYVAGVALPHLQILLEF